MCGQLSTLIRPFFYITGNEKRETDLIGPQKITFLHLQTDYCSTFIAISLISHNLVQEILVDFVKFIF